MLVGWDGASTRKASFSLALAARLSVSGAVSPLQLAEGALAGSALP
eukprot:COSAG04_NODE_29537_length_268_cov_0.857988_1_plen_45_part_10